VRQGRSSIGTPRGFALDRNSGAFAELEDHEPGPLCTGAAGAGPPEGSPELQQGARVAPFRERRHPFAMASDEA
jgi:hypothetical protein